MPGPGVIATASAAARKSRKAWRLIIASTTSGIVHLHPYQHDAADEQRSACNTDGADGVNGNAKQAEVVESHRTDHLSGDQEREERGCAELGQQKNAQGDEDGAEQTTAPRPPGDASGRGKRGNRILQ